MDQTDISNIIDRYLLADAAVMAFIFSIILALSLSTLQNRKLFDTSNAQVVKKTKPIGLRKILLNYIYLD